MPPYDLGPFQNLKSINFAGGFWLEVYTSGSTSNNSNPAEFTASVDFLGNPSGGPQGGSVWPSTFGAPHTIQSGEVENGVVSVGKHFEHDLSSGFSDAIQAVRFMRLGGTGIVTLRMTLQGVSTMGVINIAAAVCDAAFLAEGEVITLTDNTFGFPVGPEPTRGIVLMSTVGDVPKTQDFSLDLTNKKLL